MSELIRKLQNTDHCYCGSQLVGGELKLVACLFHQAAAEIERLAAECAERKTLILSLLKDIGEMKDREVAQFAEVQGIRDAAEIAYSEMAFAIHDISGMRLDSYEAIDRRAEKLSKCADELRAVLDRDSGRRDPENAFEMASRKTSNEISGVSEAFETVEKRRGADNSSRVPWPEDATNCDKCSEDAVIKIDGVVHCLNCGASVDSSQKS